MTVDESKGLEGLTAEQARSQVEARGLALRVVRKGDDASADFRSNRVTVTVDENRVLSATMG